MHAVKQSSRHDKNRGRELLGYELSIFIGVELAYIALTTTTAGRLLPRDHFGLRARLRRRRHLREDRVAARRRGCGQSPTASSTPRARRRRCIRRSCSAASPAWIWPRPARGGGDQRDGERRRDDVDLPAHRQAAHQGGAPHLDSDRGANRAAVRRDGILRGRTPTERNACHRCAVYNVVSRLEALCRPFARKREIR